MFSVQSVISRMGGEVILKVLELSDKIRSRVRLTWAPKKIFWEKISSIDFLLFTI